MVPSSANQAVAGAVLPSPNFVVVYFVSEEPNRFEKCSACCVSPPLVLRRQLLEESRIMHIREVLLRLDQASKGMLECLLGTGGTLEALSMALSRIDSFRDAKAQALHMRNVPGMTPLEGNSEASDASGSSGLTGATAGSASRVESDGDGAAAVVTVARSPDEKLAEIATIRKMTASEILGLPEEAVERTFERGRDETNESVRFVQDVCCCLGEVRRVRSFARSIAWKNTRRSPRQEEIRVGVFFVATVTAVSCFTDDVVVGDTK